MIQKLILFPSLQKGSYYVKNKTVIKVGKNIMLRVAIEGMFESFPRSFSMFQKVLRNICESIYTTATGFENLQLHKLYNYIKKCLEEQTKMAASITFILFFPDCIFSFFCNHVLD